MTKSKKVLGKGGSNRKSGNGMGGGRGGGEGISAPKGVSSSVFPVFPNLPTPVWGGGGGRGRGEGGAVSAPPLNSI